MAEKTPPDNPITESIKSATKPNLKGIDGGKPSKPKDSPNEVIEWESKSGDYQIINGAFNQIRSTRDGIAKIKLCNFTCEITEEITYEDGLNDKAFFRISGKRQDGFPLQSVDVPLNKFNMGNWITEAWGSRAIVYSGVTKRENIRVFILVYSTRTRDIPRQHVYGMTGWKKIDNQWHYLTGSGAITADGLNTNVQVDLGTGHMSKYSLPEPPTPEQLKADIPALDDLLNICPNRPEISAALLAAVARAVLGECHLTDFALFFHGQTGSLKSSITAISLAFFGGFDSRSFPANFSDSDSDLEAKGHQIKDGIYCIDDFKPAVNAVEATKLHGKTERFIRNTGNGAGRGRRNPDMTAKAAPFNRSLTIMTGEDLPKGQSILARLLVIELSRNDVDIATLSRLQQAARDGALMRIMAAYLQWLAPCLDALKKELPKEVIELRDITIRQNKINSHSRAPEMFANLVAGANVFYGFLEDVGMIDSATKEIKQDAIEQALMTAFKSQSSYQAEQDEVERFADLLRSVLNGGNGHIADRFRQEPPTTCPHSWGWRKGGDGEQHPMGDCLGWFCHEGGKNCQVWLDQNSTYAAVQTLAKRQGEAFLMQPSTLWRRFYDRGLLLAVDSQGNSKPKTTVKKLISGSYKRVMVMAADWLVPTPNDETK